jgi:hypothetical protein
MRGEKVNRLGTSPQECLTQSTATVLWFAVSLVPKFCQSPHYVSDKTFSELSQKYLNLCFDHTDIERLTQIHN